MIATPTNLDPFNWIARTLRTTRTQCFLKEIPSSLLSTGLGKENLYSFNSAQSSSLSLRRTERRSLLDLTIGPFRIIPRTFPFMLYDLCLFLVYLRYVQ